MSRPNTDAPKRIFVQIYPHAPLDKIVAHEFNPLEVHDNGKPVYEYILAPAGEGEAGLKLNTLSLRAKLKDAGFAGEEVRTIETLIAQSIKPAPDKGEVARRAAEKWFHNTRAEIERRRPETGDNFAGAAIASLDAAVTKLASIIEAELGGK